MDVTLYDDGTQGIIHGWAYEDNGSPFDVGSVIPEPSQTMLAALGALGLALRRRRSGS